MPHLQPCALLLLVGPDWRIEAISANAGRLGKGAAEELLGQPLTELLDGQEVHSLRNHMARLSREGSQVQDYALCWGGELVLDVRASRTGERYLIEAETAAEPRLNDPIGMVRALMDRVEGADLQAIADQGLRQLRALTGFDRLALRRGDAVIASSVRPSLAAQAAPAVAGSGLARIIENVAAEPVALLGELAPGIAASASFLAPSADDRRAWEAADAAATMALPLAIDGETVATLEAHHSRPRRCGAERRAVAGLFAELLVARMGRRGWRPEA
jgi:hypothetical protein